MNESVILIDEQDNMLGTMDKMQAHVYGKLHRAFSVFIFNNRGQLLLQQRAFNKYHSGGMWTNTCCSHPRLGEKTLFAAQRRLKEEMGINCNLHYMFNFLYNADCSNGLKEYEYDHVFFGWCDEQPVPDPAEVVNYKYMALSDLEHELLSKPDDYSEWLKICFNMVIDNYNKIFKYGSVVN